MSMIFVRACKLPARAVRQLAGVSGALLGPIFRTGGVNTRFHHSSESLDDETNKCGGSRGELMRSDSEKRNKVKCEI